MASGSERVGGLEVLLATRRSLVVDKPAGVPSEMTRDVEGRSVLERVRRDGYTEARLPHRLDAITGGVLVIAPDREGAAFHSRRVRDGAWTKLYVARVRRLGSLVEVRAALLGRQLVHLKRVGRSAEVVLAGGKRAELEVLAVEEAGDGSLDQADVLVRLLTGRYHQIRATLAHLGHPLAGDGLYGGGAGRPLLTHAALRLEADDDVGPVWVRSRQFDSVAPAVVDAMAGFIDRS
jgi:23S rRNA pseudouridine955/2504/2580 synthase